MMAFDSTQVGDDARNFTNGENFLVTNAGRGRELQEMLRKELGVPAQCQWFEVRFAHDDVVRVKCEYIPKG